MSFTIQPATRTGIKPLVGFYGRSGSGKTMSALLLARGIAGPSGTICMIDSENKRGSIFADLIPGGYSVLNLDAPFTPDRYAEAIATAEDKSAVVVVDSLSHEWSGEGGVLDWADAELEKMGGGDNNKMRSWIKPKMSHKLMVQRLLRCKVPLICCLRGEEKTHIEKGENGKSRVITDPFSSPLFDPRFIFEMLLNFETVAKDGQGGYVIPRKITHPSIGAFLPKQDEQIGIKHGEALARWCLGTGGVAAVAPAAAASSLAQLKKRLWTLTEPIHHGEKELLNRWVIDECLIDPSQPLGECDARQLDSIILNAEKKLKAMVTT